MPYEVRQVATWPGVAGVASCEYVCSHGISPGRAVLVTYPQLAAPLGFGDLKFFDGNRAVLIPDCKVDNIAPQWSAGGMIYTIEILDERWRWAFGGVVGRYNQKDNRQKLVPWTIRSPSELAAICLKEMGVTNAIVNLPPGLSKAAGFNLNRYLKLGENYPQIFTNPETLWQRTPPAQALAHLAEDYGCRVIYQPVSRRVLVAPLGSGKPFPGTPYDVIGASVKAPAAPEFVGVFGAPVKIQARFLLEAVGEEWDGSYVPLNQLSYSPVSGAKRPQISQIRYLGGGTVEPLTATVEFRDPKTGAAVTQSANSTTPGFTVAQRLNAIAAGLNANVAVAANIGIAFDGATKLIFTGKTPFAFTLSCYNPASAAEAFQAEPVQAFRDPLVASWGNSMPPIFPTVQATDRLSFTEAKALAQKSVFRCYRIINRDPHDMGPRDKPGRPLTLPWFGKVTRRQQILLQETKVEQVVPQGRIAGAVNNNNEPALNARDIPGQGVLPEFYNGYSRDQANVVYGSISYDIGNVNWMFVTVDNKKEQFNTEAESRVFVGFSINQVEQMIVFDEPVYAFQAEAGGFAGVAEPVLTLEAGCFVLHPDTNQPVRWEEVLPISGGTAPTAWNHREDVSVGIVGSYTEQNKLIGFAFADIADARSRAGYYLRGLASQYQIKGGETRRYIGIMQLEPDGYCQQVTWSVGEEGPSTTVSGNTEHHPAIPEYPSRRRAENLPPNQAAAAANMAERQLWENVKPKEAK